MRQLRSPQIMRKIKILTAFVSLIGTVFGQGTVQTTGGTGNCGYSGDGGQAVQAALCDPQGAAFDDFPGDAYFVDAANWRIRKIALNGVISTVAGNGVRGTAGDGFSPLSASIGPVSHLRASGATIYFG